jgi:RNA polymerase sigma factor (sigma-70 family)
MEHGEPVQLEPAEVEVLRLTDLEDLSQEEAGERMGVSRGTIWRLQKRARTKIALALTEGRRIEMVAADPE